MRTKIVLLIGIIVMLVIPACKKEGGLDKRSMYITQSLEGREFRVHTITGVAHQLALYDGYGTTHLNIYFQSGVYTGLKFFPDSNQMARIAYPGEWWNTKGYELGDTQDLFLGFSFNHDLSIHVPSNSKDLVITKGKEYFPMSQLAGDYEVIRDYISSGERGYILRKVTGGMTIEIASL